MEKITKKTTKSGCHGKRPACKRVPLILSLGAFLLAVAAAIKQAQVLQLRKSQYSCGSSISFKINSVNENLHNRCNGIWEFDESRLEACCYSKMLRSSESLKDSFTDIKSGHMTSIPVSAHKHLLLPDRLPGTYWLADPIFSSTHRVVMKFDYTNSDLDVEHVIGVRVSEEALEILYDGLYFIYSGVNFEPNTTKPSNEFVYQTWFQYVSRNCARIPMMSGVLLRTVHTVCHNCTLSQETAFTGGVFNLFAGDQIQVVLSGQGLVGIDKHTTYIGLFMLAADDT